ncbi:oligosaccharide flippase family protein [Agrilactobacillus yilanensis]|uniref:Oligosaccharide flippase family protein n=1 Tax=Agrilactobacillus yilanensis TaxID=2485997 RepID=A0ABW4J4J1_9LACO|nr:polysaccharide biosynthesis protein [Agrilactobacillus yilanensis]
MAKNSAKNLMRGALLLSMASLLSKILSAVYRVPFQNIVGNGGFYVYQQVYPLYGIGMTLALSGLPNFVSKLIAEQQNPKLKIKLLQKIFILVSLLSLGIFIVLYFKAETIAGLMGDRQLASLIKVVAFMFLLTPFLTCLRGYFQGVFDMRPTAISQVVEQILRVTVILIAAGLYLHYRWNYYVMGTVAMSGALIGGLAAIIVMLPAAKKPMADLGDWQTLSQTSELPSFRVLLHQLWVEGGSLSLFAATMVILQLVDSFSVAKGLIASGLQPTAAYNLKGIYDRAQPLVQLGLVITMAFVTALLPALSEARKARRKYLFIKITKQLVHIALALSAAATAGLIVLMPWINRLLFGDSEGSGTIALYMLSVMFMALINVFSSVLQSLDRFKVPTMALLAGIAFKMVFNRWFTQVFGISGSSLITVLALAGAAFLIFLHTPSYVRQAIFDRGFIFKLTVIVFIMAIVVAIGAVVANTLFPSGRLGAGLVTLINIGVGIVVFGYLSVKLKLLTLKEWLALPFVGKVLHKIKT